MNVRAVLALFAVTTGTASANVGTLCADSDSCFDCATKVTANDYVQFKYYACYDQLNIVPDGIQCNPFETDNFTYVNETIKAGQYKHYHWTLTTYSLINHEAGASVTFEVVPEYGYPQMFTKAQILYGGLPMCQMFETQPGTRGAHSPTWPFPDRHTGAEAQGPEVEISLLEEENTAGTYSYPGSVFSEVTWGFNASGYDSDQRPKVHTVTIPHVSYGGYFVSVYAADGHDARFSISIKAVRNVDIPEEVVDNADDEMPLALEPSAWFAVDEDSGEKYSYCNQHSDQADCEKHCCEWQETEPEDESRRRMTEVGTPAFQRKLGESAGTWPMCVQAPIDQICVSEKESEEGSNSIPEPTILVSFQTGSDPKDKYKLYFVEMNDCASQMDRNGHEYCWQRGWFTDGDRLSEILAEGGKFIDPVWSETCGRGSPPFEQDDNGNYICDPTYSEPGYCNFDGTGTADGDPAETMWTHAYDCIVWTPNGLNRHGKSVNMTHFQDDEGEWQTVDPNFQGDVTNELYGGAFDGSYRLKAIVTSYDLRINDGNPYYADWLTFPTNTWVTFEIAIYNHVSYFFNVLIKNSDGELECYKGTSARTKFWRQTTLIPVEMIEIIAVVVVLALLALLVPFILTKRKITAHLRDVYESHKYKGYLKGVDERVAEERARRSKAGTSSEGGGGGDNDDVALQKEAAEMVQDKKKKKKKTKGSAGPNKHQIQPIASNSKAGGSKEGKESKDASLTDNLSTSL